MWTRATAELPSFHGVSRKKLLACPATQMQSGGGIVDTGNQQTIASRTRVELATCEFQSSTATRGTGATSAERGGGSPTGPFTTTGIRTAGVCCMPHVACTMYGRPWLMDMCYAKRTARARPRQQARCNCHANPRGKNRNEVN
jgi:hypothetical protein